MFNNKAITGQEVYKILFTMSYKIYLTKLITSAVSCVGYT